MEPRLLLSGDHDAELVGALWGGNEAFFYVEGGNENLLVQAIPAADVLDVL